MGAWCVSRRPSTSRAGQQRYGEPGAGAIELYILYSECQREFHALAVGLGIVCGCQRRNSAAGSLAVSDPIYNRVLLFKKQAGGDFMSGESASMRVRAVQLHGHVAGDGDAASFNSPRGIASDTSDRLYVADSPNGRIVEFSQAPETIASGPTSTNTLTGLSAPQAVAINPTTSELWVANTNSGVVYRFPQYTTCQTSACTPTAQLSSYAPLGLALDCKRQRDCGGPVASDYVLLPESIFQKRSELQHAASGAGNASDSWPLGIANVDQGWGGTNRSVAYDAGGSESHR